MRITAKEIEEIRAAVRLVEKRIGDRYTAAAYASAKEELHDDRRFKRFVYGDETISEISKADPAQRPYYTNRFLVLSLLFDSLADPEATDPAKLEKFSLSAIACRPRLHASEEDMLAAVGAVAEYAEKLKSGHYKRVLQ